MNNIRKLLLILFLTLSCAGYDDNEISPRDQGDPPPTDPCLKCTVDQICEEGICLDAPDDSVNPEELVGLTFAFMCFFDGYQVQPPQSGLQPMYLVDRCAGIPPLGFTVLGAHDEGKSFDIAGATLDERGQYVPDESEILLLPFADFSANPLIVIQSDGAIEIEIEGIVLRIINLEMTGVVQPDLSGLNEGTFGGLIDPAPLEAVLGSDPCTLIPGICDEDGYIPLLIVDLEAEAVDTQIPPTP